MTNTLVPLYSSSGDTSFLMQLIDEVCDFLSEQTGQEIKPISPTPLPAEAFDGERNQYNASRLLRYLKGQRFSRTGRVLGITTEDLYGGDLNFVFGQAQSPGSYAVVSFCRLVPSSSEHPLTEQHRKRCKTSCLHELGHTYGLKHCSTPRCGMQFSDSLPELDGKGPGFCSRCQRGLSDTQG